MTTAGRCPVCDGQIPARDRTLRFHRYDQIEPSPQIDDLLREIGRDPTAIFWG